MQTIRNANDEYSTGNSYLTYRGNVIRVEDDKLNLTDMWRAAGSDPSKRPAAWLRSSDARKFCLFLAETLNVLDLHTESFGGLIVSAKGGRAPQTSAHWQIGLAYAKYLAPEFHMWCNTVVRREMEQPRDSVVHGDIDNLITQKVVEAMTAFAEKIMPQMIEHHLSRNPQVGAVTSVPALQVAIENGVKKRPRGFIQAVSNALTRFCESRPHFTIHRDVYGRKLFPREAINAWLAKGGWGPLKDRLDRQVEGQSVFNLVQGGKQK